LRYLFHTIIIFRGFSGQIENILVSIAVIVNSYFNFALKVGEGDCVHTFKQTIIAHRESVHFCELQQWQDKYINTCFLMCYNLKYPQLGYLNDTAKPFNYCGNYEFPDIFIFYSTCNDFNKEVIECNSNYKLVKHIEKPNGCYVSIYEKKVEESKATCIY